MSANGHSTNGSSGWRESRVDLSTKVAVVTGGARGIGKATCIQLAREGARAVAVVDLDPEVAAFVQDANERLGREALIAYKGDTTDSAFRRSVFTNLESRFGAVHICVPAAGITRDYLGVRVDKETGEAVLYAEEDFRRVIEIDMTAPVYWGLETVGSVAKDRRRRGMKRWTANEPMEGAVIFIGSVSSTGNKGQISYATAKAGLEGACATIASEAIFFGMRSAIIHPGYTDTPMVRALGEDFIQENILPQTQLNRLIQPEEIAHAIVFLIRNATVSGPLWADAGWHARA